MKNKTMRKAMITSIIALALCFAMLLGTTYAWFTDSVTSANNIIKSGTLDISMQWADAKVAPDNATWTDASAGAIFNYDKWEPGYVDARHIQIKNEGTLALKYKLAIVANGDVSELADVIDVYFADPAVQVADRAALANATRLGTLTEILAGMGTTYGTNHLLAGQSVRVTLALKMQESAGNEYQNKSIGTDFSVVLLATQYTYEADSFDDQYDALAQYPVIDAAAATAALAAGQNVVLGGDIAVSGPQAIDGAVLDGNGKTITVSNTGYDCGLNAKSGEIKNVSVTGTGRGIGTGSSGTYKMDGDLTVDNVTVDGPTYAINIGNGDGNDLIVKDSTIRGWTSMANVKATFTDCKLGGRTNATPKYAVFAIYNDVTFTDCEFVDSYQFFGRDTSVGTITLNNCTWNGYAVTADNFASYFDNVHDDDFAYIVNNMTVIVDGVQVQFN